MLNSRSSWQNHTLKGEFVLKKNSKIIKPVHEDDEVLWIKPASGKSKINKKPDIKNTPAFQSTGSESESDLLPGKKKNKEPWFKSQEFRKRISEHEDNITAPEFSLSPDVSLADDPEQIRINSINKEISQMAESEDTGLPPVSNEVPQKTSNTKPVKEIVRLSSTPGPFTAFSYYPDHTTFRNQAEDEKIVLLIRKHFATNIPWILQIIFLTLIPPLILPFLSFLLPVLQVSALTKTAYTLFYYLAIFGYTLIKYASWYFHVGLVTTKRIIDVDTDGILYRNVAETKLEMIEDVSYTQAGTISSIFNYGDVHIQTAGEIANFEFDKAPNPADIRHTVIELIKKHGHDR